MDFDACRSLPLFAGASEMSLRRLAACARRRRVAAGVTLLHEGDRVDFLHVLLDGQVELQGTWNDQETVITILRPVSTFILAAVVLDADALMSARTLEASEILTLPGATLRRLMTEDLGLSLAVSRDLAGGFRTMVRTVKNQKLRVGLERLANYLMTLRATSADAGDTVRLPCE